MRAVLILSGLLLTSCGDKPLNNPYALEQEGKNILYSAFAERPKHLDPARAYSSNEYEIIAQIYEPLYQYHYLKRPYTLEPLAAAQLPLIRYLDGSLNSLPEDASEKDIVYSEYDIQIQPGILYQPHPAFAKDDQGYYVYHDLKAQDLEKIVSLSDFTQTGSRELKASDYLYQIKRLVHPQIHSPIAEMMMGYIVGLKELGDQLQSDFRQKKDTQAFFDIRSYPLEGFELIDDHHFKIRIKGKYPQFRFWLAMPFFAPMPWEADVFYGNPGLQAKNISLDWYPVGTGAYMLSENNPNRRMVLLKNPHYHDAFYPEEGEADDQAKGLLQDAGKRLPFIDQVIFTLEKESIPYWNKFLQAYYDASGLVSDTFEQAIQFAGQGVLDLTPEMKAKHISLQTAVATSSFYMGFNMLDPVVGGLSENACKLRQAIAIAVDYDEYIEIFTNGRGVAAQGVLPSGIYGHEEGQAGMNPYVYDWMEGSSKRKNILEAQKLLAEAGYPEGTDAKTGKALVLYFDTSASGPDSKSILNWYRKQFAKLGIQLVFRATDYNQFQQKMASGNAQIFNWGWNADYPDPENFYFLLYGPNVKAGKGGENASNYQNPKYDALFEAMRNKEDGPERLDLIRQMDAVLRHDSPWLFGYHPKNFLLRHEWYQNLKSNLMANNELKYQKIDTRLRSLKRAEWNKPIVWPLTLGLLVLILSILPAWLAYRRRQSASAL